MEEEFRIRNPIRRDPPEESDDLYDGLCVDDERISASITIGKSRLPLWAIIGSLIGDEGWAQVLDSWPYIPTEYNWTRDAMSCFLYFLMQPRGEFGRLLLILADVERISETERNNMDWYEQPQLRQRVKEQLQRCLNAVERAEAEHPGKTPT